MDADVHERSAPAEPPMRARPLVLALVGWTAAAVVSGVVVGYLLSWTVFEPDPEIMLSSLATFVWSAVFAGLTGLVVIVIGTIHSVRRHVPELRRTRTGVAFVAVTVVCAPTGPFALVASVPAAVLAAGLARRPRRWWPWLLVPALVPPATVVIQRFEDHLRDAGPSSGVVSTTEDGRELWLQPERGRASS